MKETNEQLAARAQSGDTAARHELIMRTQGMVHRIAGKYRQRLRLQSEYEDLIQAGNIGIAKAIDLFDPSIAKFTTYVWRAIEQHMKRYILVSFPVTLPNLKGDADAAKLEAIDRVHKIGSIDAATSSITGDSRQLEITDLQQQEREQRRLNDEQTRAAFAKLAAIMDDVLSKRERFIIERRHGIGQSEAWTLTEIGKQVRLTRERVRQIERIAMEKLIAAVGARCHCGEAAVRDGLCKRHRREEKAKRRLELTRKVER